MTINSTVRYEISQARQAGAEIDPAVEKAAAHVTRGQAAINARPGLTELANQAGNESISDKDLAKLVLDYRTARTAAGQDARALVEAAQANLTRAWAAARPEAVKTLFVGLVGPLETLNQD